MNATILQYISCDIDSNCIVALLVGAQLETLQHVSDEDRDQIQTLAVRIVSCYMKAAVAVCTCISTKLHISCSMLFR